MYVRGGARITKLLWQDRGWLLLLATLALLTELFESYVSRIEFFSVVYVGVLSAALSIFLVFRFNEAYERWWEARKLWGRLVNLSRDFARQSLTLLSEDQSRAEGRRLVYGQIAFVHALRMLLRDEGSSDAAAEMLRRLLPEEAERLLVSENIPNALLCFQADRLAATLRGSTDDRILLTRFDATISGLHDVQGGCERIKNTTFPDAVTLITRVLVWGMVLLLLLATLGPEGRGGGIAATIAVCIMALGYIWIESLGRDLNDPFEGRPNDIPMTSLSVTIERDLREMLGETDLPEPVKPVKGVLM